MNGALDGISVGHTAISTVDLERNELSYRGFFVSDLLRTHSFAQVSYLLLEHELPSAEKLGAYLRNITENQSSQRMLSQFLQRQPAHASAMTILSAFALEQTQNSRTVREEISGLIANLPNLLAMLICRDRGQPTSRWFWPFLEEYAQTKLLLASALDRLPNSAEIQILDKVRTLYAEHGFNASTFAARVATSAGISASAAVSTALTTFNGSIHGRATEHLLEMFDEIGEVENVAPWVEKKLSQGDLIMGFGHRIYRGKPDARFFMMREQLASLSQTRGDTRLLAIVDKLTKEMAQRRNLYPNVDLACGPLLRLLGFKNQHVVAVTAVSRLVGWCAHILEQKEVNRIIRPSAGYSGPIPRAIP